MRHCCSWFTSPSVFQKYSLGIRIGIQMQRSYSINLTGFPRQTVLVKQMPSTCMRLIIQKELLHTETKLHKKHKLMVPVNIITVQRTCQCNAAARCILCQVLKHTSRTCNQSKIHCRSDSRNKLLPSSDSRRPAISNFDCFRPVRSSACFSGDLRTCRTCNNATLHNHDKLSYIMLTSMAFTYLLKNQIGPIQ